MDLLSLGPPACQWEDVIEGKTRQSRPKGNTLHKIGGSYWVFMQNTMLTFLFDKTTIGVFPFITTIFFGLVIREGG